MTSPGLEQKFKMRGAGEMEHKFAFILILDKDVDLNGKCFLIN